MLARIFHKTIFRLKQHYVSRILYLVRSCYWRIQGMTIGKRVRLSTLDVTWPHKVSLGDSCSLEHSIYFNLSGPYSEGLGIVLGAGCFVGTGCEFNISSRVTIGENCLIASGTRFIDHNHGMRLGLPMKEQQETQGEITVGRDVWIGANSIILQGVTIGEGAVVGAGSVVTKPVAAYSVMAGAPARLIRRRYVRQPECACGLASAEEVFEGKGELGLLVAVFHNDRRGDG